jgi:hypothetical protein
VSEKAKAARKRAMQPAYRDGVAFALLIMAEQALIRLVGDRRAPEYEHVSAAFTEVLRAKESVWHRLQTRT